jgi:hypothetical protein
MVNARPLHHCQRFPRDEAELRVQRQRTRVIRCLHQAHLAQASARRAFEHRLHQPAADGAVLAVRVNSDGPDAGDAVALPQEVAASQLPVLLGDYSVDVRAPDQLLHQLRGDLGAGKVRRKAVPLGNRFECFVADAPGAGGVARVR